MTENENEQSVVDPPPTNVVDPLLVDLPAGDTRFALKAVGPLLVICCLGWGLALGTLFWRPFAPLPTAPAAPLEVSPGIMTEGPAAAPNDESSEGDDEDPFAGQPVTLRTLQLVDVMLTHGNVAQAMDTYARLVPRANQTLHAQLKYRMCIAREMLGQHEAAAEHYQQLLAETSEPIMQWAAKLGQARVWLKSQRDEMARATLAHMAADANAIPSSQVAISGEVAHLFALSFAPPTPMENSWLIVDDHLVTVAPHWNAGQLLSMVHQGVATHDVSEVVDEGDVFQVLYQYGKHPSEIQVRVSQPSQPVEQLVHKLSEVTQLEFSWSDDARERVAGRSIRWSAPPVTLAVALDTLLTPLDVVWSWEGTVVQLRLCEELPAEEVAQYRDEASGRLLRYAVAAHPNHPLAEYSYLELGSLAARAESDVSAVSIYQQFEEQFPRSTNVVVAQFNAAKILLRMEQSDKARDMFFQVADGGHGHPLQSAANAYAGRLTLATEDSSAAIRPLLRSVATAPASTERAVPVVTLASAYLFAGNPHVAVEVLMEERAFLLGTEAEKTAAFISSYAQFIVAESDQDLRQHGRRLLSSLAAIDVEQQFGQHYILLVGNALQAVGLVSQMEHLYRESLERKLSPWIRQQVRDRLIEYLASIRSFDRAEKIILTELSAANGAATYHIKQQLAGLLFQSQKMAECLSLCRELLDGADGQAEKAKTLQLMGRVFESQDAHYQAALCFAGMMPNEDSQLPDDLSDSRLQP